MRRTLTPTPLPARRERGFRPWMSAQDALNCKRVAMGVSRKRGDRSVLTLACHPQYCGCGKLSGEHAPIGCHSEPAGEESRPLGLDGDPTTPCGRSTEPAGEGSRPRWSSNDATFTAARSMPCTMAGRSKIVRQDQDDTLRGALIIAAAPNHPSLSRAPEERLGMRARSGTRPFPQ